MKKGCLFYVYGITLIFSLFVFFSVTSCSEAESLKNQIIGKWVEENDFKSHLEFLKDGTVVSLVSHEGVSPEVGDFKFISNNRLRIDWSPSNIYHPAKSEVFYISIDKEGLLTLKDPAGKVLKLITETEQEKRVASIKERLKLRFTDNGNGVVTDNNTKLMWTRNADLPGERLTWDDAMIFVQGMNKGDDPNYGYTDWRLPTKEELMILTVGGGGNSYAYFASLFTNVEFGFYWSSTTNAGGPDSAWIVSRQ